MTADAIKAGALILFAALVQVSIASTIEVAEGHPDVVLVLVISIALLRGPVFGAVVGFWAGLVLDVISFQTLGLTSLLLTLAGYFAGRLGEVTKKSSAHPSLVAVTIGTIGVGLGSAVLHFMRHLLGKNYRTVPTGVLCLIKCDVGVPHEFIRGEAIVRRDCDPDRGRHADVLPMEDKW